MQHEQGDQLHVCLIKTLPGNKTQWDKITLDEGQKEYTMVKSMLQDTPPENYTLGKTTTLIMLLE